MREQQGNVNEQQMRNEMIMLQQRLITLENAAKPSERNQPNVTTPMTSTYSGGRNYGVRGVNPQTGHTGMLMDAPIIDGCPVFTPATYSQWKREVKLWAAAQCGATQTQLLSKLITVLPQPAKISGLTYMEATEITPESRHINTFLTTLDERYGGTDSEKSRAWLNAFTEFTRDTGGNLKDFWARFPRVINRLGALNMKLSDQMVFNKALQALTLPEGQAPIVISALETRRNPNDVQALKEITIRMYETHKVNKDNSDVSTANTIPEPCNTGLDSVRGQSDQNNESMNLDDGNPALLPENAEDPETIDTADEYEWTDNDGTTYLIKPKRPVSGRNQPGQMITATRGSIANFKGYKNGKSLGKGKGKPSPGCIRCGASDHRWRQCPFPFQTQIPMTGKAGHTKGKPATYAGKGKKGAKPTWNAWDHYLAEGEGWSEPMPNVAPSMWRERSEGPESSSSHLPSVPEEMETEGHPPSWDVWEDHYTNADALPLFPVFTQEVWNAQPVDHKDHHKWPRCPILVDSGASYTVVGKQWLKSWSSRLINTATKSDRKFRFGDGGAFTSLGTVIIDLKIPKDIPTLERPSTLQSTLTW